MQSINTWGLVLDHGSLVESQRNYLESLPKDIPNVEWVWAEMDRVWDKCGLDNHKRFSDQDIGSFYGHPVWIMNGLFTEIDPASIAHRKSIADYLKDNGLFEIADYGGGSGVLAEQIAKTHSEATVEIVEPYASDFFINKLSCFPSVRFVSDFSRKKYDCVLAQDVLEHIENPIETAFKMSQQVRIGGFVVFANCFYPVIKCHLPSTFYLRHTFKWVMKIMGLIYIGRIPDAEHALVFQKKGDLELNKALIFAEKMKFAGPIINMLVPVAVIVKRIFR